MQRKTVFDIDEEKVSLRTKMFEAFMAHFESHETGEDEHKSDRDSDAFQNFICLKLKTYKKLLPQNLFGDDELIMRSDDKTENLFFRLMLIVDFEANTRRVAEEFSKHNPQLYRSIFEAIQKYYAEIFTASSVLNEEVSINKKSVRTKIFKTFLVYHESQELCHDRKMNEDSSSFKNLVHSKLMTNKELLPKNLLDGNELITKADENTENLLFEMMLIVEFEANISRLAKEFSKHDSHLFCSTFKAIEKFYADVANRALETPVRQCSQILQKGTDEQSSCESSDSGKDEDYVPTKMLKTQPSCTQRHGRQGHLSTRHKCDQCDKKFVKTSHLKRHSYTHLEEKSFKCKECEQAFRSPIALLDHKKRVHDVGKVKCTFEGCSRRVYHLAHHLKTHLIDKPHKCDVCDKCFLTKRQLTIHMRRHTGETPFECAHCNKKFTSKSLLRSHKTIHSRDKLQKCDKCARAYLNPRSLKNHILNIHGALTKTSFKCKQCGKVFEQSQLLSEHMRQDHHREVVNCTFEGCSVILVDKPANIEKHKLLHSTDDQFKCVVCGLGFLYRNGLKRHVRNHRCKTILE